MFSFLSYGLRSVDAHKNITGILGYAVSYVVDSQGGHGITTPPPPIVVPSTEQQTIIAINSTDLKDGDTIVVWLNVADAAGNKDEVRFHVGIDRTVPVITADSFQSTTLDPHTARLMFVL